ncbi:MAG: hypothetical protein ACJ0BU_08060 [Candidatus Puniceispirillales bacterium]
MWTEKSANARTELNQPLWGEVRRMVPSQHNNLSCFINLASALCRKKLAVIL